jgi:hypothetical protein
LPTKEAPGMDGGTTRVRFTATHEIRSSPQVATPPMRRLFFVRRGRRVMVK